MRRALLAVSGIVAGTTLLISLKSAPGASRLPGQVAADNAALARALAAASTSASAGPVLPPATAGPAPTAGPGTAVTPRPGQSASTPAGRPASTPRPSQTTKPPAAGTGNGARTVSGDSQYTEFGYVTVAITVTGTKITDVTAVEMPGNEQRSTALSAKAAPILRQRALTAQSSTIDSVSGATYTSQAYKASLQSAIDHAGLG